MAFIVKKIINGKEYYYLRKSVREGKKVKAVTLAYLGKTKKQAEQKMQEILKTKEIRKEGMAGKKQVKEKLKAEREIKELSIEDLAAFCKRKGFVFPSSLIYGGFSGFWDFGHLGVELFNNIKKQWWNFFVQKNENMVGIDSSIISHPRTWKASGHLQSFSDVSIKCKKCNKFNKVDRQELGKARCGFCQGELDEKTAKNLNLMFKTPVGPVEEDSLLSYLRPETAQGMFMDFKLVAESFRMKLPFGIAQIGKCFRNEIAPRDFLFRSREFTIAEFEFFIYPDEKKCELLGKRQLDLKLRILDKETQEKQKEELRETMIKEMLKEKRLDEWHAYWLAEQILWFKQLGLDMAKIKVREHLKTELSHYSSATFDIDFKYPFGSLEVAGNSNRGTFDLTQHETESKEKLEIFDEKTGKKVIPRVIEPTFGIERVFLAVLADAYTWDEKRQNIVLKLNPRLAPIKAAVFPIVKKPEYERLSEKIVSDLKREFNVIYDISGSIGRRYSRNDEIGTPYCITIDEKSPKQKDITVRNRDDTKQIRVKISELRDILRKLIAQEIEFEKAGKIVETRVK